MWEGEFQATPRGRLGLGTHRHPAVFGAHPLSHRKYYLTLAFLMLGASMGASSLLQHIYWYPRPSRLRCSLLRGDPPGAIKMPLTVGLCDHCSTTLYMASSSEGAPTQGATFHIGLSGNYSRVCEMVFQLNFRPHSLPSSAGLQVMPDTQSGTVGRPSFPLQGYVHQRQQEWNPLTPDRGPSSYPLDHSTSVLCQTICLLISPKVTRFRFVEVGEISSP